MDQTLWCCEEAMKKRHVSKKIESNSSQVANQAGAPHPNRNLKPTSQIADLRQKDYLMIALKELTYLKAWPPSTCLIPLSFSGMQL